MKIYKVDKWVIRQEVEAVLEKYRIFKFFTFDRWETSTTASYSERFHGPTNEISDQVATAAVHNADESERRRKFCERVEWAVNELPDLEKKLIQERYLVRDYNYITDFHVYEFRFNPPISGVTYATIRERAMYNLALLLGLYQVKIEEGVYSNSV